MCQSRNVGNWRALTADGVLSTGLLNFGTLKSRVLNTAVLNTGVLNSLYTQNTKRRAIMTGLCLIGAHISIC